MKTYNIHESINLRGLTFDQKNIYDVEYMNPQLKDQVIGFRDSIEITSGDFDWGNIPLHVEVLMHNRFNPTKEQWYKSYRAYRAYCNQALAQYNANYKNFVL